MTPGKKIIKGLKEAVRYARCQHEWTYWEPRKTGHGWTRTCAKCKVRETTLTMAGEWQPENKTELSAAILRLETELPGWWWRVGACHVSADASIGPDSNGPDAYLLGSRQFDDGFDCDLRMPATVGQALNGAIDLALDAKRRQ